MSNSVGPYCRLLNQSNFSLLERAISGLISMNSFVSTSLNEAVTYRFLTKKNPGAQDATVGILFKMTIDAEIARKAKKPFANISQLSFYGGEEEILLSMGTVFRVDAINQQSTDVWHVTLTMCSTNQDPQFEALFNYAKTEICCVDKMTYSTYGKFLAFMSHFDSSIAYYHQLLSQVPVHLQLNDNDLATIHNDFAYAYRDSRRYEEALQHYHIALELKQKRVPLDEVDLATTLSDLGWLLMNMENMQEALDLHQQALDIRERHLGHDHSDTAMSYNCRGLVYTYSEHFARALDDLKEALAIRQRCLPAHHPYTAMSYSSLGSYYEARNDYSKALDMHDKALSIYKSSVPPSHGILKNSYWSVSALNLNQRQWHRAIEHLTPLLTFYPDENDRQRAVVLSQLGDAYSGRGEYHRALTSYEEALRVAQKAKDDKLVVKLQEKIEKIRQRNS